MTCKSSVTRHQGHTENHGISGDNASMAIRAVRGQGRSLADTCVTLLAVVLLLVMADALELVAAPVLRLTAREQDAIRRAADENAAKRGNCRLFPSWRNSAYVLPWARGLAFVVTRTWDHFLRANGGVGLYAIDVPMPIGTTIVAARAGRVVAVREEFADGNGEDLKENFVFVRHADGTIARYFHLTRNGALVDVGEEVRQGEPIALSGNTGDSAGPHLHFDVQACGPNLPPNYNALPCGQTIPVTFRNTTSNPCGLMVGERYEARGVGAAQ